MTNDYTNNPGNLVVRDYHTPPSIVPSIVPSSILPITLIIWPILDSPNPSNHIGGIISPNPLADAIGGITGKMRGFESGATRDTAEGKIDYEGCLSPLVLEAFGEYMLDCSICSDGTKRPSDNWQKGIPLLEYVRSLLRHTFDVWKIHRGYAVKDRITGKSITMKHALCAVMFNVMGYLHEYLKKEL